MTLFEWCLGVVSGGSALIATVWLTVLKIKGYDLGLIRRD